MKNVVVVVIVIDGVIVLKGNRTDTVDVVPRNGLDAVVREGVNAVVRECTDVVLGEVECL